MQRVAARCRRRRYPVIAALCALLVVVVVVLRRGIVTYNVAEHRAADIVARYGSVAEDGRRVPVSFPDGTLMRAANIPRLQNWWNWLMSGNWEPSMLLVIQTVLSASPGAEYIDVGCWCGGTALYAAHFASRVYAIDADFEAIRMAASNIVVNDDALQRRIELFNVAIAPTIGTATVYGRPGSSSASLHREIRPRDDAWRVPSTTLEAWARRAGVDCSHLRLVNIDVEGFELDVVESSRAFLTQCGNPDVRLSVHRYFWKKLPAGVDGIGPRILEFMLSYPHVYDQELLEVPRFNLTMVKFTENESFFLSHRQYDFDL